MDRPLTKENVVSGSHWGSGIYSHILRQYYPTDFLMKVAGDDCGWCRNPWDNSARSLHIWMEKVETGEKNPRRIAVHHDTSGHIPDGNCLDFAEMFYQKSGEELLRILNEELFLHLGETPQTGTIFPSRFTEQPRFSFFRAPVANISPHKQITLRDTYNYIIGHYARTRTEDLRAIRDERRARHFKAVRFDYVTFSGTFTIRRENALIKHSGLLCLDFDHVAKVEDLFHALLKDDYFETQLLFRSPSGHGLKWVIPTDLSECGHTDFFRSVAVYVRKTYHIDVDPTGKDVCRACFLPWDPCAYISESLF